MYKAGSFIFTNNTNNNFFSLSRWIRFFTGKIEGVDKILPQIGKKEIELTHSMDTMGRKFNQREDQVFSAEPTMSIMPLRKYTENENTDYLIYEWIGVDDETLAEVAYHLYDKYVVETYGVVQLFGYIYKRFMEVVFGIENMIEKPNFFPNGNVCSELLGRSVKMVAENRFYFLTQYINRWNLNSAHPLDLYWLVKMFPEHFKLVERKGFDKL